MSENLTSPVVNPDCSVTFYHRNEHAKLVEITGELKFDDAKTLPRSPRFPLSKTSNGVWTITSVPMLPGRYSYTLVVDGVKIFDPFNPLIRRISAVNPQGGSVNVVEIKDDEPQPWDFYSDISHGTMVLEKFYSKTLNQVKGCALYLPPGYKSTHQYPILYLLHGSGGDYLSWFFDMNLDNLMDYLRSNGAVPEMIVAMPDGHEGTIGTLLQPYSQTSSENNAERRRREYKRHISYFVNDVIPFIESKYSVSPESRAIAGLSMGGYQTTHLITTHPDLFHAAGIFSAGAEESVLTRFSSVKDHLSKYRLVYLSCGSWDFLFDRSKALSKTLNELGISHVYYSAAAGHCKSFWSRSLTDFVTHLSESL